MRKRFNVKNPYLSFEASHAAVELDVILHGKEIGYQATRDLIEILQQRSMDAATIIMAWDIIKSYYPGEKIKTVIELESSLDRITDELSQYETASQQQLERLRDLCVIISGTASAHHYKSRHYSHLPYRNGLVA